MQENISFLPYVKNIEDTETIELLKEPEMGFSRLIEELSYVSINCNSALEDINKTNKTLTCIKDGAFKTHKYFNAIFNIVATGKTIYVYLNNRTWKLLSDYWNKECGCNDFKFDFITVGTYTDYDLLELDKFYSKDLIFVELFLRSIIKIHGEFISENEFSISFSNLKKCFTTLKTLKTYIKNNFVHKEKIDNELKEEMRKCLYQNNYTCYQVEEIINSLLQATIDQDYTEYKHVIAELTGRPIDNDSIFIRKLNYLYNKYKFTKNRAGYMYHYNNPTDVKAQKYGTTVRPVEKRIKENLSGVKINKEMNYYQHKVDDVNTYGYFLETLCNGFNLDGDFYDIPTYKVPIIFECLESIAKHIHSKYYRIKYKSNFGIQIPNRI